MLSDRLERTPENMRHVIDALDRNGLAFMPLTAQVSERTAASLRKRGLEPLRVDETRGLLHRVLTAKQVGYVPTETKNVHLPKIQILYLNDAGMLEAEMFTGAVTEWTNPNGLAVDTVQPENLSPSEQVSYRKAQTNLDTSGTAGAIAMFRVLLRLPDVFGGTVVDPHVLRSVIRNVCKRNCLDGDRTPDLTGYDGLGNSVAKIGLTVLDYIRAEYSIRILQSIRNDVAFLNGNDVLPIHWALLGADADPPDNWPDSEKLPCVGGMSPDPYVYRILTKINRPILERETGNEKRRTFDFVRIFLGVKSRQSVPNRRDIILRYKKDLAQVALIRLMMDNTFCNMGVPINMLRLTRMTMTRSNELELVFELKRLPSGADG